jgi:dihydropteroate synthase
LQIRARSYFSFKSNELKLMFTLNCKDRLLVVDKPWVMGIINTTPDSFYPGSRFNAIEEVLKQAEKMIKEGADIIDVGGQSTRPGSNELSAADELERVIGIIESLHFNFPKCIISIDTFYSTVARAAVEAGASLVNDISSGSRDSNMLTTVANLRVPYIVMHMKGTPATMQQHAQYESMALEILDFFIQKLAACRKAGIKDLIIDPGFGFAKTIEQNFILLKQLGLFKILDAPILCGLSRKSMVYKSLGITVDEALNGTTVLNTIALLNGANILRVHDVKEAREVVKLVGSYVK